MWGEKESQQINREHGIVAVKETGNSEIEEVDHIGCRVDYGVGHILFAGEIAGFLNLREKIFL